MKVKIQHQKQISHFGKEFDKIKNYRLEAWQKSYVKRIRSHLIVKNFKRKTLIDIGTGRGHIAIEIAKLGLDVIACDLTPQSIENLKRYKKRYALKNLKLIVCPAENIPLKDKSVDYIVANAILEHIPNERKAIAEWRRILKPRGKIFITVPLKFKYIWPFFWPINWMYDRVKGHLRRYDLDTLEKKFKLRATAAFYTGHELKMLGIIFSELLAPHSLDDLLEKVDRLQDRVKYGASNIIAILQKER